eukprot:3520144-Prorocentrum_lima.AAC.1
MTSSLVGSEMCIRDSHSAEAFFGTLRKAAEHHVNHEGRKRREAVSKPVSYTHLTLPTICSV